tara:strand:- start:3 stop:446 length:444 start_codon:yes stop_codon:yes gene_type:complete
MIIVCPCGEKKFQVKDNQIPEKGRRLKCGYCDKEWFFKKNVKTSINDQPQNTKIYINDENQNLDNKTVQTNQDKNKSKDIKNLNLDKKKYNYFKIFIVLIISIIAFIVVLDTFKNQLTLIFPNLSEILNNLYESLTDLKLFIKDLIK